MNSYERKRRICKMIVLVLGILSINNIILTIRNYSYAYFEKNVKTGVKLKITTLDEMPVKEVPLLDTIKAHLNSSNSITDTDGKIYLSGDNETINFNYVWYSGKLWRIVVINSDGSIKMVTQDAITAIYFSSDSIYFRNSLIYQWLNEDFKDTLYNYENIIVQNANWNATLDGNSIPVRPETLGSQTVVQGDVGLLNAYEYYLSYKNTSSSNSYLNIGYSWYLITPYNNVSNYIQQVSNYGNLDLALPCAIAPPATRPSIILKSGVKIASTGNGSSTKPYQIVSDKAKGKIDEKINERISGEYVKIDNKAYRIVGIENGTTKLTSVDYVRDGDTILTKSFGNTTNYADSVASINNDYWGYYLNNTWLTTELKKYITEGTYYLGRVGNRLSYKNSICSASNTTLTTKSCSKTTSTWGGLVGLPRVGEMFSTQLGNGYSSSSNIWLITPYGSSNIWYVMSKGNGYGSSDYSLSSLFAARPSIYLKSSVKITGGDGMSESTAYTIGL